MLSTKYRSKPEAPLPRALTTPFMSQLTNGVRPRMKRRIPSIQSVTSVGKVTPIAPKKPSSAGSTRSNSSAKSSISARSTVSAKSSSSTSERSAAPAPVVAFLSNGDLNQLVDYDDEQDIRFVNVPSGRDQDPPPQHVPPKQLQDICPEDILREAQESDGSRVYQIDLHGAHVGCIANLDKFPRVRVLDLSCNHITCIDNLHHCKDLRELKLYDNAITEIKNLDNLQELCHLQLQHNKIRALGRGLSYLRKLQVLRLDSNCLLKVESRDLTSCANLTSIDLSNNKLDSLSAVSCLPNLEELHAVNNRLRTVADLSRCKKLQEVDLSYNRLTDVAGLKGLNKLTCLHLAHNQLANMKSLGKVRSLEELNLASNRLTDAGHVVTSYPALQILDVSENHLEEWSQALTLSGLSELVELYIAGNPFCRENGAKAAYHTELHSHLPGLEILDGAHVKRPSSRPGTPLMRPMSAATVVTARQVENQLTSMETDIVDFETSLSSKFDALRSDMSTLPIEPPSRPLSVTSDILSTPGSSRPSSKCGKRSRLQQARAFAENHFEDS